ncbi:MAG TPA: selenide, water dikinase SelD [Gemmatimonadaceae bacterium]|nr:selenide, water dikinase SelD [Gemmatimonadaceae bacterium]
MGPGDLARALGPLPHRKDPRLLVGRETFDDAGVFVIADDFALVQTVDFFAPIVDDPYTFGRIAAANALSDVYAMGGEPLTALNIVGFPASAVPLDVLTEILRGGQDAVHEAGAVVAGGHSIIDEEIKYGLSVTGRADPRHLLTNAAAKPGDRLLLTKPLGTGLLATAAKSGKISDDAYRAMITSMQTLNRDASRAALALDARCATDITGFGLLGHASHIARASDVTLEIRPADLPVLPGAREAWRAGARTGGAERNLRYLEPLVRWGSVSEEDRALLIDPQTSGGLLVALPPAAAGNYIQRMAGTVEIGSVTTRGTHAIVLT